MDACTKYTVTSFTGKSVNLRENEGIEMLSQYNKWNKLIPKERYEVSEVSRYRYYWRKKNKKDKV